MNYSWVSFSIFYFTVVLSIASKQNRPQLHLRSAHNFDASRDRNDISVLCIRLRGGEDALVRELTNESSSLPRTARRRKPPQPKASDVVVPDHCKDVLSAVLAVGDGGTIYVRRGNYHWSEEDTGNTTRSEDHDFGGCNDIASGRAFVGRQLTVRGDIGATLWGRWVLLNSSSGRVRDITLAYDMRALFPGQATLLVMGRAWSVRESDVRAALGTAVALWGEAELELECSGAGGVDTGASAQACQAVWSLGRSELRCIGSTLAAARSRRANYAAVSSALIAPSNS